MAEIHPVYALYVHIPFCGHICPFCAFSVLKDAPHKHQDYLEMLKTDLLLQRQRHQMDFRPLRSIYFGGGTPSKLTPKEFEATFQWLETELGPIQPEEITVELNPEDVTKELLTSLKACGVNRLSLGIQSFNDFALSLMERRHSAKHNHRAIELVERMGFDNYNLDFLFAWPGQSLESFEQDLHLFLNYSPRHLSTYLLNLEEKTKISKRPLWVKWLSEEDDLFAEMYLIAQERLEAQGILQYEVSNFAQAGFESRQNLSNWSHENYLGLGMSAHSLLYPYRFGNETRFTKYKEKIGKNQVPFQYHENLTPRQAWEEQVMTGLRQNRGIPMNLLGDLEQAPLKGYLNKLTDNGLAQILNERLHLTPEGLLMADLVTLVIASIDGKHYGPPEQPES